MATTIEIGAVDSGKKFLSENGWNWKTFLIFMLIKP